MIRGGRDTVVVVVVVTTVCCVAGPKDMDATVECCEGIVCARACVSASAGWEVGDL